jgi:uncharacterized Zn finger protein
MEIQFRVQGSSPDPYLITFIKDGDGLVATCTCAAGEVGQSCKHRLAILSGDASAVVSKNGSDAELVASWLPGTPLASALEALANAERQLEDAKRGVSTAKRRLSQALMGR